LLPTRRPPRPTGHSFPIEIERKFLLNDRPPALDGSPRRRLEQGYLAVGRDGVEVRIRRAGDKTTLTVKSAPGLVRVEEEIAIDGARFDALWPLTEGRRLVKTRYLVPLEDGLAAEVDEYGDALHGLWTAEVEFPSVEASEAFAAPAWLGDEVTGDERYANRSLALDGAPGQGPA
jgi:adenylate cyclase